MGLPLGSRYQGMNHAIPTSHVLTHYHVAETRLLKKVGDGAPCIRMDFNKEMPSTAQKPWGLSGKYPVEIEWIRL